MPNNKVTMFAGSCLFSRMLAVVAQTVPRLPSAPVSSRRPNKSLSFTRSSPFYPTTSIPVLRHPVILICASRSASASIMRIPAETEVYFSIDHAGAHVDQLLSSTEPDLLLESVEFLKNVAIGSNKQKEAILSRNLVPRLLYILQTFTAPPAVHGNRDYEELLCETTSAINSLSKGTEEMMKQLMTANTVPVLLTLIMSPVTSVRLTSILLRTLSSLFRSRYAPHSLLYEVTSSDGTQSLIERLLALASPSSLSSSSIGSMTTMFASGNQEAVCTMISHSINERSESELNRSQTADRQRTLSSLNAIPLIADLIMSPSYDVQVAALTLLSKMTYNNREVSKIVVTTIPTSINSRYMTRTQTAFQTIPDILTEMMSQEGRRQMQLLAAKCMTYLYRSEVICAEDKRIVYKTLPTLVRCCKDPASMIMMETISAEDQPSPRSPKANTPPAGMDILQEAGSRAEAASLLAFLTETDTQLQQIAATCDQVILTIHELLKFQANAGIVNHSYPGGGSADHPDAAGSTSSSGAATWVTAAATRRIEQGLRVQNLMKESAFKVFASLTAHDEEVRKRVLDLDNMMDHVVSSLTSSDESLRTASLKCLHSLSRSVQQFKQHFPESTIWPALKSLITSKDEDVTLLASSTLCNLLMEMSPAKAAHVDKVTLESLANLTRRREPDLRMNGVWALMNMAHKADQSMKLQIMSILSMEGIYKLLQDDTEKVVLKTLGLLRNLLTNKPHIDHLMSMHGKDITDSLILIIDSTSHSVDVKEQAFCVIANIADGDHSKDIIMTNDEILNRLLMVLDQEPAGITSEEGVSNTCSGLGSIGDMSSSVDLIPVTAGQVLGTAGATTTAASAAAAGKRPLTKLQIAVTYCITNLVWAGDDGASERQAKMKEIGILKCLNNLVESSDTELFHKVKTALQQFPNKQSM